MAELCNAIFRRRDVCAAAAIALGLVLTGISATARAEDCHLARLTEMPIIDDDNPVVSILIDDQPRRVLIDTGGFWSMMDPVLAANYKIRTSPVEARLGLQGVQMTKAVRAPSMQLGIAKFSQVDFFVMPPGYRDIDATLGANWLQAFDVEIDPIEKKVSMFTKEHCEGKVIYWPHSDLAIMPVDINKREGGHITIPVRINGEEIRAFIDTGAPETVLDAETAESLFGVKPDSPGAEPANPARDERDSSKAPFRYRFKSLELDGIAFNNPLLMVAPISSGPKLILGMHQLRNLHLYFAYGEKKLYVTSARGDLAARQAAGAPTETAVRQPDPLDRTNAQDYLRTAMAALGKKDFDGASAALAQAMRLDPGYAQTFVARAQLYAMKDDAEHAFQDLAEAIRLDPKDPSAYMIRAALYAATKDQDRALQDLSTAIQAAPKFIAAYTARSRLYEDRGDFEHAFADADTAARLSPKDATALNNRCWFGAILGHLDAAMNDCDAALRIDPHAASILDSRGYVNLKAGRFDDAIDDYDEAIEKAPKLASSLYGRGLAERQKGKVKDGDADIAAAQAIDPDIAQHFGK